MFCYNSNLFKFYSLGFFLKKIILTILLANIHLFSAEINNKVVINIPKQDSNDMKIPALDLKVGESGIITRNINGNNFILGIAIVNDVNDGVATIETKKFESIKNIYMPNPIGTPNEGDKITFRILYDRALIIAPNQNIYQEILNNNKNIDFIHPDIFASYLATNDIQEPQSDDFRRFCNKYNIGIIFITKENYIDIFDCQSFKVITTDSITIKDTSTQKPFYTRLSDETINALFDLEDMKDYFNYYGVIRPNN